jgi:hypothetical protein
MRLPRLFTAAALAAAMAVACSDSTAPTEVALADLVGSWDATSAVFTPVAGGTGVDVVDLGFGFSMVINAEGGYVATLTDPIEGDDIELGTLTVANGVITFTPTGEDSYTMDIVNFDGNTLTVRDDDESFDFDDDDVEEDAVLTVVLEKA